MRKHSFCSSYTAMSTTTTTTTTLQLVVLAFVFAGAVCPDQCASPCDASACSSLGCPGLYVPDPRGCCPLCSPLEGDPCGRRSDLPCGDRMECKPLVAGSRRGSKRACRRKTRHRVCGSDGTTYGNAREMRADGSEAQKMGRAAVSRACSPSGAGASLAHPSSPRYKFNFIADVVEKMAPAVVHIELFVRHPLFGRHMRLSSGSGFVVTHSGLIVTNAHVVTTAATVTGRPQLRVQLHDGEAYGAVVRDVDRKADIATVKINPQRRLPVLSLGRSADLRPGEFVVAIGSPFALQNTVTTGIVSTAQRDGKELGIKDSDMDYVQTDAIINYGNSGGPLVNLDGEVIGINTLKVTAGIAFAIPSDRISRFLTESQAKPSKENTKLQRRLTKEPQSDAEVSDGRGRFLGITMLTITNALVAQLKHHNPDFPDISSGVLVQQVIPNGPAENGGIKTGDVIVTVNGRPVESTEDIHEALKGHQPLLLEVRRGNEGLLFYIQPQATGH